MVKPMARIFRMSGLVLFALALLSLAGGRAALAAPSGAMVAHEIRYRAPEAGEVALVWGVNGWQQLPSSGRPAGTTLITTNREVMRTPMQDNHGLFQVIVEVPEGSVINFAFQITRSRSGVSATVWDLNGAGEPGFMTTTATGSTEIAQTVSIGSRIFATPSDELLQLMVFGGVLALGLALGMLAIRKAKRKPYLDF